jgi:hypothetical protein
MQPADDPSMGNKVDTATALEGDPLEVVYKQIMEAFLKKKDEDQKGQIPKI